MQTLLRLTSFRAISKCGLNSLRQRSLHSIPTIDLSDGILSQSSSVYDACALGVFYCTGHHISDSSFAALMCESEKFFDLPLTEKMKIHVSDGGSAWRGYMHIGGEATKGRTDVKEGMYLGPEHNSIHPRVLSNTPLYGMNQFLPQSSPDLRVLVQQHIAAMTHLGQTLTEMISHCLGLHHYIEEHFLMDDPLSLFRLWRYPSMDESETNCQSFVYVDHSNITFGSLLFGDPFSPSHLFPSLDTHFSVSEICP